AGASIVGSVDLSRRSGFVERTDGDGTAVAADRDRVAEEKVAAGVRCFEIRLLRPRACVANEDVRRARVRRRIVFLVAVDRGGAAVFADRAGDEQVSIAAEADRIAELIALFRVSGVRSLDVGLLRPRRAAPSGDV